MEELNRSWNKLAGAITGHVRVTQCPHVEENNKDGGPDGDDESMMTMSSSSYPWTIPVEIYQLTCPVETIPQPGAVGVDCGGDHGKDFKGLLVSMEVLKSHSFLKPFHQWYLLTFRATLNDVIMPNFWKLIYVGYEHLLQHGHELDQHDGGDRDPESNSRATVALVRAVDYLYSSCRIAFVANPILRSSFILPSQYDEFRSLLTATIQAHIRATMDPRLHPLFCCVYRFAFEIWNRCKMISSLPDLAEAEGMEDISSEDDLFLRFISAFNSGNLINSSERRPHGSGGSGTSSADSLLQYATLQELNIIKLVAAMHKLLIDSDLADFLVSDVSMRVVETYIGHILETKLSPIMNTACLKALREWLTSALTEWLRLLQYEEDTARLEDLIRQFTYALYESYGDIRLRQIFTLIIDYPDTCDTLKALRICMEHSHLFRSKLVSAVSSSLQIRLLHQGVNTGEIITGYTSTIKTLRYLDSSGVALQLVSESVRRYLKSREDTIRCIITKLIEDEGEELAQDLQRSPERNVLEAATAASQEERITFQNWHYWSPDPIEALATTHSSQAMRSSDILSILLNIYEGKDTFVQEYQKLLGLRLLDDFERVDHDGEVRTLELLTVRFGENDFNACEVMLKDIQSSRRITKRLKDEFLRTQQIEETAMNSTASTPTTGPPSSASVPVSCLILSHQFWPEKSIVQDTDDTATPLKLPSAAQKSIDDFTRGFESIKANRTLKWLPTMGTVDLDLELNGRRVSFSVSPAHAIIISLFERQATQTIHQMSIDSGLPPSVVRKKIFYWTSRGLLVESDTDEFSLVDDQNALISRTSFGLGMDSVDQSHDMIMDDMDHTGAGDDPASSSMASRRNAHDEQMWNFLCQLIRNFNSLGIDRLHSLVQQWIRNATTAAAAAAAATTSATSSTNNSTGSSAAASGALATPSIPTYTVNDLRAFLDGKIREGRLVFNSSSGEYQLPMIE